MEQSATSFTTLAYTQHGPWLCNHHL